MKPVTIAVFLSLLLAGCQGSVVGDALAGKEGRDKQDDAYCQSIGATKGTNLYVQCRMQATQNRDVRHAAAWANYNRGVANMNAANANMNQNRMVTTNCNRFGNSVNCTSF